MMKRNFRRMLERIFGFTPALAIIVFLSTPPDTLAQMSNVVGLKSEFVLDGTEPVEWPEARGLESCVRAGLLSQKRFGAYTITGWVRHWETNTIHNTVAIVLHGDDGMVTRFTDEYGGKDPRELISQVTSPTFHHFTLICETLTDTQITFTPVPSPGQAER